MSFAAMPTGPARILLAEDDAQIRLLIEQHLVEHGFHVRATGDGSRVLEMARQEVDLIVLDLQLPRMDGLEVLRRLRLESPIPVIIVSARSDGSDRVAGLELGADDYLVKPFLPRELVARIKALLRRAHLGPTTALKSGPLTVDVEARRVTMDGEAVELTPREFELLRLLCGTPGKTFSREELLDRVWGAEYLGDTRRVDIHISKVRSKLSRPGRPAPIRSVWGVGYRYEA